MSHYECVICLSLNSTKRLHCRACGSIPAMYSPIPEVTVIETEDCYREIVRLSGAQSIERWHFTRLNLKTVSLDYYASE